MRSNQIARRTFLKTAAQAAIAVPAIAVAQPFASAQKSTPAATTAFTPTTILNPRDFGATGDGVTKDTLALQLTIERCSVLGGGEVLIPAGEYLTGALALRSNVTLRIAEGATLHGSPDMADYAFAQIRWEGKWRKGYLGLLSATDAENIAILGPGKIIGTEAIKVRNEKGTGYRNAPLMEFTNCKNVKVADLYTQQFSMWSIHPVYCEDITFSNVVIKSGADGIDADSCRNVVIDHCDFETGDDCISLKSGRGMEAHVINRPCENVTITNCTFVDRNFACIGIGSEVSAGVRNVRVAHCKFNGAHSHAIYIKSRIGRGAFIEDITVTDSDVTNTGAGFLRINSLNSGKADEDNVPGNEGIPVFRNLSFSNIRVTDVPHLVQATEVHPDKPLEGLTLTNITGTAKKGMTLAYVKKVHLSGIKVTGVDGPMLATKSVTGTGLTGSVELAATDLPKVPDLFPVRETPYKLN